MGLDVRNFNIIFFKILFIIIVLIRCFVRLLGYRFWGRDVCGGSWLRIFLGIIVLESEEVILGRGRGWIVIKLY